MSSPAIPTLRFLGCDVGKAEVVVFDSANGETRKIVNEPSALSRFASGLDKTCFVVCEATGGYENNLLAALLAADVPAHRADARKVKAFIRSFGTLGKTDAIDAKALARYAKDRQADLQPWQARERERLRLHELVMARRDLVKDRLAYANRRDAPTAQATRSVFEALIASFDQQLAAIEADIQALVEKCEPIARAVKTLTLIPGVGAKTAAALLALLPELGTTDRKKIAALAGLAPHPVQSGNEDKYRKTRGGRPEIKRVLFMAALSARKHNKDLKTFFERLVQNGKKPLAAITAVMRKIVVIANAKIKDDISSQLS